MPQEYKDHALHGDYEGSRECHIAPDWLLIYEIANGELLLYLQETGSHSELFKK
jgi:mRNA interferase YafQ